MPDLSLNTTNPDRPDSPDHSLAAMRHSCAHLLAAAIQELWPNARFGVGPTTDDGFYYDGEFPQTIVEADLASIEERMRTIQARDEPFVAEAWPTEQAIAWMRAAGQTYKVELIEMLRERGSTAVRRQVNDELEVKASEVGIYRLGEFTDLCKGPHVGLMWSAT